MRYLRVPCDAFLRGPAFYFHVRPPAYHLYVWRVFSGVGLAATHVEKRWCVAAFFVVCRAMLSGLPFLLQWIGVCRAICIRACRSFCDGSVWLVPCVFFFFSIVALPCHRWPVLLDRVAGLKSGFISRVAETSSGTTVV